MRRDRKRRVATLSCPQCGYDVRSLREPVCPECGESVGDEVLRRAARRRERRRRLPWSLLVNGLCLYAPYGWLVLGEGTWSNYRWQWIRWWPGLPGLLPSHLLFRSSSDPWEFVVMLAISLSILLGTAWLGRRGPWTLIMVALVVLVLSSVNSWMAWHAFRA